MTDSDRVRVIRLLLVLVLSGLARAQVAPVTAAPGFVSQTQFTSCTQYKDVLDCGDTNNNVTVLSLAVQPGTGQATHYEFQTVTNIGSLPANGQLNGVASCTPGGQCTLIQKYRVTVTTKPLLVYYEFHKAGINTPYFYSAHHTNAFNNDDFKKDSVLDCAGEAIAVDYLKPDEPKVDFPYNDPPNAYIGALWSRVCTLENGPTNFNCNTYTGACSVPFTGNPAKAVKKLSATYPGAYDCSGATDATGDLESAGFELYCVDTTGQKCDVQNFKNFGGEGVWTWLVCNARVPLDDPVNFGPNSACPFFMQKFNGKYQFPLRYGLPIQPDSPVPRYSSCGNPAPGPGPDRIDPTLYAAQANNIYPYLQGFKYNSGFAYNLQNGALDLPPYLASFYSEPHMTSTEGGFKCGRVLRYLNDASPARQYYASLQYQGPTLSKSIYGPTQQALAALDPNAKSLWTVTPVIIGCGVYFSSIEMTPVSYEDIQPPYYKSSYKDFGTRHKNSNSVLPCGDNDFFCATSRVGSVPGTQGGRAVPMARCFPSDACGEDRTGIYTYASSAGYTTNIKKRFYTAETAGSGGPQCQVNTMLPTAKPFFQATAVLEILNADGVTWDPVSNTTVTNVSFQEYSEVFTPEVAAMNPASLNFAGRQGNSQPNNGPQLINLEFDYFDTPNGQIAPDFPELNLMICNTSDSYGQIFMTVPQDPTRNPWELINEFWMEKKTSGGYTPLPKYLKVVTALGNRTINPDGAWFYWDDPKSFGTGAGQLGMPLDFYADRGNAQYTCSRQRYATVPGFIEGFDWTIEDRITDQLDPTNPGAAERALRKTLRVATPCVVAGYLRDYDREDTCEGFRQYEGGVPLRFMFENFVPAGLGAKCPLPRCWVNGGYVFCTQDATTNNNIRAEMRLAVLGTALVSRTVVSVGQFITTDPMLPISCAVDQGTSDGVMRVYVKNTGMDPSPYQVYGNCTGGIQITATVVPDLAAGATATVDLVVRQFGLAPNTTKCTLTLTNPTYTQLVFDQLTTTACVVIEVTSARQVQSYATEMLCEVSGICPLVDAPRPDNNSSGVSTWVILLAFVFLLVVIIVTASVLSAKTRETKTKITSQKRRAGRPPARR